jgi:hypothetical protein
MHALIYKINFIHNFNALYKIELVYETTKIITDLSPNFSKADIILLNKLYWLLIFINFVLLTLSC